MTKPVSVLIVEDKVIIAELLAETLVGAGYNVAQAVTSGEAAIDAVRGNQPDVILMDIHLAGKIDGIQTSERINAEFSIPTIYLTDLHDEKTIERAKHTQPAAFLLKPFKSQDLLIAIEIAFFNASNKKGALPVRNERTTETIFPFTDRLLVKDNDTFFRINVDDILWIEAGGSYCHLHTVGRKFTLTHSLKVFQEKFDHPLLMRVHRSFAVNIDKVTAIKGTVLLIDETEIPTSDSYRDEVHRRFSMI
jgi:DNA-binding LytR/AlgR family response regulator